MQPQQGKIENSSGAALLEAAPPGKVIDGYQLINM